MKWMRKLSRAIRMELREHKSSVTVYMILRLIVIGVMCVQFYNKNFESAFLCILISLLLMAPSFVQVTLV